MREEEGPANDVREDIALRFIMELGFFCKFSGIDHLQKTLTDQRRQEDERWSGNENELF